MNFKQHQFRVCKDSSWPMISMPNHACHGHHLANLAAHYQDIGICKISARLVKIFLVKGDKV